jgi:hypothetical protein
VPHQTNTLRQTNPGCGTLVVSHQHVAAQHNSTLHSTNYFPSIEDQMGFPDPLNTHRLSCTDPCRLFVTCAHLCWHQLLVARCHLDLLAQPADVKARKDAVPAHTTTVLMCGNPDSAAVAVVLMARCAASHCQPGPPPHAQPMPGHNHKGVRMCCICQCTNCCVCPVTLCASSMCLTCCAIPPLGW